MSNKINFIRRTGNLVEFKIAGSAQAYSMVALDQSQACVLASILDDHLRLTRSPSGLQEKQLTIARPSYKYRLDVAEDKAQILQDELTRLQARSQEAVAEVQNRLDLMTSKADGLQHDLDTLRASAQQQLATSRCSQFWTIQKLKADNLEAQGKIQAYAQDLETAQNEAAKWQRAATNWYQGYSFLLTGEQAKNDLSGVEIQGVLKAASGHLSFDSGSRTTWGEACLRGKNNQLKLKVADLEHRLAEQDTFLGLDKAGLALDHSQSNVRLERLQRLLDQARSDFQIADSKARKWQELAGKRLELLRAWGKVEGYVASRTPADSGTIQERTFELLERRLLSEGQAVKALNKSESEAHRLLSELQSVRALYCDSWQEVQRLTKELDTAKKDSGDARVFKQRELEETRERMNEAESEVRRLTSELSAAVEQKDILAVDLKEARERMRLEVERKDLLAVDLLEARDRMRTAEAAERTLQQRLERWGEVEEMVSGSHSWLGEGALNYTERVINRLKHGEKMSVEVVQLKSKLHRIECYCRPDENPS